jgi:hypothetical protein
MEDGESRPASGVLLVSLTALPLWLLVEKARKTGGHKRSATNQLAEKEDSTNTHATVPEHTAFFRPSDV